jgi:dTDP-4-dehydrorhamnose reductase
MCELLNINNALIFGGNGMIGYHMKFGIKPSSSDVNILDETLIENYIKNIKTDVSCIINLVSLNLRDSEKNINGATCVNIVGTTNLVLLAKKMNIPFILLSTGAVFSSNNDHKVFTESTKPNPKCFYGCTKFAAEKVSLIYEKTIIIRTGWVFGGVQKTHYKFVEHFLNNFLTDSEVRANDNFNGSPTYVVDLVNKIKYIVSNEIYGIHHVVNSGVANGFDVAKEISEFFGGKDNLIIPVNCEMVPNSGPKRGVSEILESNYEYNKMRSWREALREYIKLCLEKKKFDYSVIKYETAANKIWTTRETCRLCNSKNLQIFFKLEPSPQANHFVKMPVLQECIPLDIATCHNCKHIQLMQILDCSYQYSEYLYVTSATNTMVNHITNNIEIFLNRFNIKKNDNILEIGANDGTGIKFLINKGFNNSIGVDPATNINDKNSLPIICDFFGSNILNNNKIIKNSYKLIYAFHCCAHIENLQDVFFTVNNLLDDDGIFVMEVGYFYEVYKQHLFDTIYHEHIDYHTCTSMQNFCINNNLFLVDVKTNKIQSGSIQFYITKNKNIPINQTVTELIKEEERIELFNIDKLTNWKNKILLNARDFNYLISSLINEGKIIFGYGASAKSTTLIHQFKLTNKQVKYIIDDSRLKQNLFTPGSNIPITSIDILNREKCDYLIILSWNFLDDILLKISKHKDNGLRIIVPFPNITIL